ncbi:hypothetical protein Tco_0835170, partial [Tanacetum coccineum]
EVIKHEPDYIPGPEVPPSPDYIPGPDVPPSPNYIPGPEEPQSPLPLDFVPKLMYPEYIPQEDEILHGRGEHALTAAASPIYRFTRDMFLIGDFLALTTPPPSPLTPLSSPLPHIPSPPLPIPSPPPNSPTHIEIPESCLPLRKRVHFDSPTPSHEVGESSAAGAARQDGPAVAREDPYSIAMGDLYGFVDIVDVTPRHPMSRELDYGITDTWDDLVGAIDEIAPTTLEGVNQRVTDLATIVEQETTSIDYAVQEGYVQYVLGMARRALISELQTEITGETLDVDVFLRQMDRKGLAQPKAPGEAGSSS